MITKPLVVGPVLALLLSGCSLVPDYLKPDLPVPDAWPVAAPAQPGKAQWADLGWKEFFADPVLQGLITQALDNNRDLRVAALNVELARSTYRVSRADLFPTVNAGMSDTIERTPKAFSLTYPQAPEVTRTYTADLGVTAFELDLFGKLRARQDAALEQYFATEEAQSATRIALVAEVANAALTLLADRKLLALTVETLDNRRQSLELVDKRFSKGVGTQLDVAQARTAVESARASLAAYQRQLAQDANALGLLVGGTVDQVKLDQAASLDAVSLVGDLPVGLPSEVMLRRPDIRQAEHQLKSANADIGAARAAFYPTVSLTAALGTEAPGINTLFTGSARAWSFAPQVGLPIFDAGRNEANLDSAKTQRAIAVAQYEKAIQAAFREVADALAARTTLADQDQAQKALVDATQQSKDLSQARYDHGVDSYLNVLDAQRSLYAAQQDAITVQLARQSNLVNLYKVLGGGRS
jgi:multidrug efflux system outer membrane protein